MRLCYVLKWFPRLSQTFVLAELQELRRQGFDVTILALKAGAGEQLDPAYHELDAPVYYLPDLAATTLGGWSPELIDRPADLAAVIAPFLHLWNVQHIHAHFASWAATLAMQLSRATDIPFSFTAHARDIFLDRVSRPRLVEKLAAARFVVTVSEYNRHYLDDLLKGAGRSGRVLRIYNGIDAHQIASATDTREPNVVVGVGRLVPKKGFAHLVEACRLLREQGTPVRCIIVGDGPDRAALARQIAEAACEQAVALVGALPRADVLRLMRRASAFALPCAVDAEGDRDGLPTVLVEAMASETPVVSTRLVGIPELVEHERTGLLVEQGDAAGLADAIGRLLASASLRRTLAEAALEHVRRQFDLAENVRQLGRLFAAGVLTGVAS